MSRVDGLSFRSQLDILQRHKTSFYINIRPIEKDSLSSKMFRKFFHLKTILCMNESFLRFLRVFMPGPNFMALLTVSKES